MAIKAKANITLVRVNDGANGSNGVGIKSADVTYQAGSSQTSRPTGTWLTTIPKLSPATPYLWTKTVINYTDGKTSTSYSVSSTLDGVEIGGRNLIVKATLLDGYRIATDGSPFYDAYHSLSDYIKVAPNASYTMSEYQAYEGYGYISVAFYDADKNFISRPSGALSATILSETYESPDNAAYARTSFPKTLKLAVKLERGTKATDWTPAPEDTDSAVADAKKAGTDAATAANAAQSTAIKAVTNAATAQSTANTAVSNASKAQTTANTAVSNAAAAQQSANNAQTTASDAQSKANNLMTMIRASEAGIEIGKSSDGTTFTTTRTKIDEDSFDILDKNGNVLNTFEKTGQTLYVEGVDNFSVRSDPNYQTYVYTDARRFTIDSKNRVITYGVYDIDLTLAENAILGMYVYTESGMDTEDLKSRITSTVKETDLPSHTGRPGLTGTIITVSYNPSSSTDKITKYGMNRVALKIKSNGKILAFNFGTSNSHVGYGSMTLGYGNLATGSYSTAFGVNTESHGDNSVSMGTGTYAMQSNSLAVGIYNDPRSNTLFSVGNGTDQDNRSNAFWVNDDGNALAASHFTALEGLGTNGTLDVRGHSTLNTLLVANNFSAHSTANISGALTAGSIKTSGSLSSGALTIHGSRKIDGIWEGSKVIKSAGQSTAFMSASEFQTITGYSLSTAKTDWALLASNGEWDSSVGRNFTLGWTSNYINVAVNPSTGSQIRVNYTFIKFA